MIYRVKYTFLQDSNEGFYINKYRDCSSQDDAILYCQYLKNKIGSWITFDSMDHWMGGTLTSIEGVFKITEEKIYG